MDTQAPPTTADMDAYLRNFWSTQEMAKLCDAHEMSVRRWISQGKLTTVKVGMARLIPATEIGRFLVTLLRDPMMKDRIAIRLDRYMKLAGVETLDHDAMAAIRDVINSQTEDGDSTGDLVEAIKALLPAEAVEASR